MSEDPMDSTAGNHVYTYQQQPEPWTAMRNVRNNCACAAAVLFVIGLATCLLAGEHHTHMPLFTCGLAICVLAGQALLGAICAQMALISGHQQRARMRRLADAICKRLDDADKRSGDVIARVDVLADRIGDLQRAELRTARAVALGLEQADELGSRRNGNGNGTGRGH